MGCRGVWRDYDGAAGDLDGRGVFPGVEHIRPPEAENGGGFEI